MCGRISQARDVMDYLHGLGIPESEIFERMPVPRRFNVSPSINILAVHMLDGNKIDAEPVHWGYHSAWAKKEEMPPTINATIEKAMGGFWKSLWKNGRLIVPADGWYEWVGEKPNKQPYFITPRNHEPMFMCAVSNWKADPEKRADDAGLAIVTSASLGGMVDVHDRRPIVLSAVNALEWLDLSWSPEQAEQLARETARPPEDFEWYPVTKAVGSVRNDGPEMVVPLGEHE